MADPIVYGPAYSTNTRSVRLTLEEKGVAYRLEEVDIFDGSNKAPEHLARQPFGKVPAFEHDGFALHETQAIMHYVDETFDGPRLAPAGAADQARMIQGLCIVDNYAYPSMIGAIVIQRMIVPMQGGETDEAAADEAAPLADRAARALDALIGAGDHVASDSLSLADLQLAPVMAYFGGTPEGEAALAACPNLARWWTAMQRRDSVVKTQPRLG